jgi:hypothetical protein
LAVVNIADAQQKAIAAIAMPGDWWTGAQRVDVWRHARDAVSNPLDLARRASLSPFSVDGAHDASDELPALAVDVVHRIASDPGRLTRNWADEQIAVLGEESYTELVGLVAIASVIDSFHRAMGRPLPLLPVPRPGEPARVRPDDVGDIGAWVSQTTGATRANVSRTLSLVPVTNDAWRELVDSHYSRGAEFMDAVWQRPLNRPQVELVASRTTGLNECFY